MSKEPVSGSDAGEYLRSMRDLWVGLMARGHTRSLFVRKCAPPPMVLVSPTAISPTYFPEIGSSLSPFLKLALAWPFCCFPHFFLGFRFTPKKTHSNNPPSFRFSISPPPCDRSTTLGRPSRPVAAFTPASRRGRTSLARFGPFRNVAGYAVRRFTRPQGVFCKGWGGV